MPIEAHGKAWRVRIRWRGLLNLSVTLADKTDAEELEAALVQVKKAGRRDIIAAVNTDIETLPRLVERLRRIQPRAITVDDLKPSAEEVRDTMTVKATGEQWLKWMETGVSRRGRAFAPGTIENYKRIWDTWLTWNSIGDTDAREVKAATLSAWRTHLTSVGKVNVASANRHVMAVQAWGTWLRDPEHGLGLEDLPPLRLRQLNEGVRVPRALLPAEVDAIRAALSPEEWLIVYDLLLGTGLRVNELLGLTAGEVALGGAAITLADTTGRKLKTVGSARTVPVPKALRGQLEALRAAAKDRDTLILPAGLTNRWGFRQAWERAATKAKLQARPHDLRHTRAVRWIVEDGHDLATVRDYLGHSSLSTTDRYTRAVADYRLKTAKTKKGGAK